MRRSSVTLAVLALAILANYAPLLDKNSEQDGCAFGQVSNPEYREYLARAATLVPTFAPSLYNSGDALALQLDDVYRKLSKGEDSIYQKIAIMHAILRAVGAEYRNTNGNNPDRGRSDPFVKATTESDTISFNYVLDVNRLLIFWPWPRQAWLIGSLAGPRYTRRPGPMYPDKVGEIAFIVHPPDIKMRPMGFDEESDSACPPVPRADLAVAFSGKKD
jgi:hypothetical protein